MGDAGVVMGDTWYLREEGIFVLCGLIRRLVE